ncbi:MAG: rod shape-determining protein MreC [Crocinitomicaceae bacterium]|nr:rod shape-determining protein MreC [Crocinitomicaceae bacterium]
MRNLIAFFQRFRVFVVFVVLQIIAMSTYFSFLNFPRTQYLTSASSLNASFLETKHSFTKHFNLVHNNYLLQLENIALRKKLPQSYHQLQHGYVKIDDTLYKQQYTYTPALVINSTCTKENNYFTLDIGKDHGIHRGMGVFSDKGIVGVIHKTSDHYSIVKSVLTENINVDVMIEPIGLFGLLKWDGKDPRRGTIAGISNDMKIKRWSKVVTRGGSGIFPRGLNVGKIEALKSVEGKPIWDVVLRFSEDYRKIQRVYVIKNLLQEEQFKLEESIPQDKEND